MTDATEPLDLAPIKVGLANYASGPENDLTGHMIARDLAHATPSLVAEVERLQAKVAAFADIEEAHNASYRMLRDQSGMTELVAEVERLRARLDAVLAIHSDRNGDCAECEMSTGQGVDWPCYTYNAALGVE